MNLPDIIPFVMFAVLLFFIMSGYPVALTLAGTALLFAAVGDLVGIFHWSDLGFVPGRIFGVMSNVTLMAVPLFIFMGIMLEKSGIARDLLSIMGRLMSRMRGSLALSVVAVGAVLAATTGIVGATVVTMGVIALPTMLARGYDKRFATGVIAASGTLGQIIPPSIILVLLGDLMNVDVGDLFIGALGPSVLLIILYLTYIVIRVKFNPRLAGVQAGDEAERVTWRELQSSLVAPLTLIVIVLGSILFGVASPTEAAACGAAGSLGISSLRRQLSRENLWSTMEQTARITAMVFLILIGAQFFGVVFRGLHGEDVVIRMVESLDLSRYLVLFLLMLLLFFLGFFLDFLEICFIVLPIAQPIFAKLGFDPLWVAILIAINLQTSFLTPPFGFALFYLKGVSPPAVSTLDIYRGAIPFVVLQILALLLVALFPQLIFTAS